MDGTNSDPAFASITFAKDAQKGGVTVSRAKDKNQTRILVGIVRQASRPHLR